MIRGELKIERDTEPSTNRVNVSGDYDYDISKNIVTFSRGGITKNIKVLSITELGVKSRATEPTIIKLTGVVRAFDLDAKFFRLSCVEVNKFDIRDIKCNFKQSVFEQLPFYDKPWNILEKTVTIECKFNPQSRSVDVVSIILK